MSIEKAQEVVRDMSRKMPRGLPAFETGLCFAMVLLAVAGSNA